MGVTFAAGDGLVGAVDLAAAWWTGLAGLLFCLRLGDMRRRAAAARSMVERVRGAVAMAMPPSSTSWSTMLGSAV